MRRPIFIGDVQGCADELEELLDRAEARFADDFTLWVAGDLVNRGPDNLRALRRVRELVDAGRGEYVLGNHEIHLISAGLGVQPLRRNDTVDDVLDSPEAEDWVDWLRCRPLVVPGEIAGQAFAMVHAASAPTWSLDELVAAGQAVSDALSASRESARALLGAKPGPGSARDGLDRLTRCRSVWPDGRWSSAEPDAERLAWHEAWSAHGHPHGIVYGHWARQGLHCAPGLRGLDSGCVHHGRGHDGFLTAWLPEPDSRPEVAGGPDGAEVAHAFDVPDDRLWQIPARRRYYDPV